MIIKFFEKEKIDKVGLDFYLVYGDNEGQKKDILQSILKSFNGLTKKYDEKEFLENMGIIHRAQIIAKKMKFSDQSNLYLRLKRLLSSKSMGNLFKVILAHNNKDKKIFGFN